MGVTHHWKRPTELPSKTFQKAIEACAALLDQSDIDLSGYDGSGKPIIAKDRIVFNGHSPPSCEPFEIAAIEFDRNGRPDVFSYCKTNHQP